MAPFLAAVLSSQSMTQKPVPKRALMLLVSVGLVLIVTLAVLLVTGQVLGKMGDATGQSVLDAIALGAGIVWAIDVVCLVLALGVNATAEDNSPPDEPYSPE